MDKNLEKQLGLLLESNLCTDRIAELLNIDIDEVKKYAYDNSYKTGPELKNEKKYLKILFFLYNRPDLTCYAIAKLLKVSQNIVYDINEEYMIRDMDITRKNYKNGQVENKIVSYLKETDLNKAQIARIFKVSPTYVASINKKYSCR